MGVGGVKLINEWLLAFARWLDTFAWSTEIHESLYLYAWIETTHVLTLMVFLGFLIIIDLRMLGWAFTEVPASRLFKQAATPMYIGFVVMVVTGVLLFFAIPVRTTQSIWFRIKVVLLVCAAVNVYFFHARMRATVHAWDTQEKPPPLIRRGAGASLAFWTGVIFAGRAIAYDWYDCHQPQSAVMYWLAGCVDELAAMP